MSEADFETHLLGTIPRALRLAETVSGSVDDATDIVQDASIAAWRYRASLRGNWEPWFLAIVYKFALRNMRRRWITIHAPWQLSTVQPSVDSDPAIAVALAKLNYRQRLALTLRYGEDMSIEGVAQVMGIRSTAAKQLLLRSRESLRRQLMALEEETSGPR